MRIVAFTASETSGSMLTFHDLQRGIAVCVKQKVADSAVAIGHRPHPIYYGCAVHGVQLTHEVQGCQAPIYSTETKVLCEMCFQAIFALQNA